MNKKNNNKGFTLAELLIVVAIIAVLVAIAIPVFTTQLEKSREATDLANIRSAYSELVTKYLDSPLAEGATYTAEVPATQTQDSWQSQGNATNAYIGSDISFGGTGAASATNGNATRISVPVKKKGANYKLTITYDGVVSVT